MTEPNADHADQSCKPRIYPHDRLLERTILRMIPRSVKPNHVTVARLLLTPVVVIILMSGDYLTGLIAFLMVAFTDAIDGSMARTRDQITDWGKIYDPIADKILIGSAVFILVLRYIDFWTAIMIIGIEAAIIIFAWVRKVRGGKVEANIWGKIKMNLQVLGVSILLLSISLDIEKLMPFASGALYLAIAFAIISLLTYGI